MVAFLKGELIQFRVGGVWQDHEGNDPDFEHFDWRPKPAAPPPPLLEAWVNVNERVPIMISVHATPEEAQKAADMANGPNRSKFKVVHMREVLEGGE
jgi:hypothetical protein